MTLSIDKGKPIPLCGLQDIQNIVRLVENVEIPPHHAVNTSGKFKRDLSFEPGTPLQWYQATGGFLDKEPGLLVVNGLNEVGNGCKIPLTIVNQTSKCFRLKKGNVVARVEAIEAENFINEVHSISEEKQKSIQEIDLDISN
jgi:hypothetical protein